MADRFVIIDGTQYDRKRAEKLGLLKTEKKADQSGTRPAANAPTESRARGAETARKGQK